MAPGKKRFILAIDQGTTGSMAMIVDHQLNVVAAADCSFPQYFPQPGWVEHDPNEIWNSVRKAIVSVLQKARIRSHQIEAIGLTNQRETTIAWNRRTGNALDRALVWQDRRTSPWCIRAREQGLEASVHKATGLLLDPYFSATKIKWLLEHSAKVKRMAGDSSLAFGTVDAYLLYRLTGGEVFATEPSNASRTALMDLAKGAWCQRMCETFELEPRHGFSFSSMLPEIKDSFGPFGRTKGLKILPDGIPITGILGDQQAALLGQACLEEGDAKCTFGTGSFLLVNAGPNVPVSKHRLLSTVAWRFGGELTYALEGSAFAAGACVQWFRDLGIVKRSADIESLASRAKDAAGVLFVPALAGLGPPYWSADARGAFLGLTRGTQPQHLARALLEGIARMNAELARAMELDLGRSLRVLHVDGGASENSLLMQIQSDLLGVELVRPKVTETTALGAAVAAGLGHGMISDFGAIRRSWKKDKKFKPRGGGGKMREMQRAYWERGVDAVIKVGSMALGLVLFLLSDMTLLGKNFAKAEDQLCMEPVSPRRSVSISLRECSTEVREKIFEFSPDFFVVLGGGYHCHGAQRAYFSAKLFSGMSHGSHGPKVIFTGANYRWARRTPTPAERFCSELACQAERDRVASLRRPSSEALSRGLCSVDTSQGFLKTESIYLCAQFISQFESNQWPQLRASLIMESVARSTVGNAVYSSRILKDKGAQRVVIATTRIGGPRPDNHPVRARRQFLLRRQRGQLPPSLEIRAVGCPMSTQRVSEVFVGS